MDRHEYLFQRFLDDTATPEEREELYRIMKVIDTTDTPLFKFFGDKTKHPSEISSEDKAALGKLYHQILLRENITAAQHTEDVIPIDRSNNRKWWLSAAAAIVLLVIGATFYNKILRNNAEGTDRTAATIVTPDSVFTFSGKGFLKLPDNSTVTLNKGSELTYTASYGKSTREVVLKGEAFFDVAHDPDKKFMVRSGKVLTSVLGTAFNVKAFPGDHNVVVTVARGKVSVAADEQVYGTITPNEQIAVNTNTLSYVKQAVNTDNVVAWKNDFIIIDDQPLEDAVAFIAEKYNVKITLANEGLKKCRVTSEFFEKTELKWVLQAVSTVAHATYDIDEDGNVTIRGEGCK